MNPTSIFLHALYLALEQSGNEATRQLSGLPLHLSFWWGAAGVQTKPYESISNAASRRFLGIRLLKVSEWMFLWHRNLGLHLKTKHPKY